MSGRKSIFRKLVLIMLFLSLVSAGIILGIALNEQKKSMENNLIQENKRLAQVAARSIEAGYIGQSWPLRTLRQISNSADVLFWWIVKPDGIIHLADDTTMCGKIIDITSFGTEERTVVKDYVYGGENIKFLVQPLHIGEPGKIWNLCIGISLKSVSAAANKIIITSLGYFSLIIAFACALSFLLARRFTKPLVQLVEGTKTISRGDFDAEVEIKTGDEIEELGNTFNKMAGQVKRSFALEKAAREETENIMNTMINTLVLVDSKGNIRKANKATFNLLGYKEDELIGKPFNKILGKKEAEEELERLTKEGAVKDLETIYLAKDGRKIPVSFSASSLKGANGELQGVVCDAADITERKQKEEQLFYMATHDTLTDLSNRVLFSDRLKLALHNANRNKQKLAVMLTDLDNFKDVNDPFGHTVGDKLLQIIANRLKKILRKSDTAARIGGDEFLLLLPEIAKTEDAAVVAQKILKTVRELLVIDEHELNITTSIGIAIYPNDGEDINTLIKNADTAMYHAKEKGRNNYQYYTTTVEGRIAG